MNYYKIAILSLITLLFSVACKEDFEEVNTNTLLPREANPGSLLPTIIDRTVDQMLDLARNHNHELMQYTSMANTVDELHWYRIDATHSDAVWSFYNSMQDVRDMNNIATVNGNNNYAAIALIWKSLLATHLTDVFIEVPYEEASRGEGGIFEPEFDSQREIYAGILRDLEEANHLIIQNEALEFGGDILYNGDMLKWKKFANSLRIRYLMRASKRPEINAEAHIKTIISNPDQYPVFEHNEDGALLRYSGNLPFVNPNSLGRDFGFDVHSISTTFVNQLKALEDPRLPVYVEPTIASQETGDLDYIGLEPGLPFSEVPGIDPSKSTMNQGLRDADLPAVIMSYSELAFLLAEASMKGFIDGDAKGYYEKGIRASMEYWEVEMPEDYLTQAEVAYNNSLEQIITQKWIAQYWVGMEAWFDYRRTGFPVLHVGAGHDNNGQLPVRYPYPTLVSSLNSANYEAAVSRLGGDNINLRGWWEKE